VSALSAAQTVAAPSRTAALTLAVTIPAFAQPVAPVQLVALALAVGLAATHAPAAPAQAATLAAPASLDADHALIEPALAASLAALATVSGGEPYPAPTHSGRIVPARWRGPATARPVATPATPRP
jgi:hypothetical protein